MQRPAPSMPTGVAALPDAATKVLDSVGILPKAEATDRERARRRSGACGIWYRACH